MDILEFAARPLLLIARFLLWLAWDFMLLTVAWSIGWPLVRVVSLGRFPHVGIGEFDASGTGEAFVVCGTGFVVVVAAIGFLARHYGWG